MTGGHDAEGETPVTLQIGRVVRSHGIRGEVVVAPVTNRPERFTPGAVHLAGRRRLVVERARPLRDRWLVRYEGVDGRDAADALRGQDLFGEPLDVLAEGEMWVHELVGSEVVDRAGSPCGTVVALEVNPAHDLLVLDTGALVPVVFVTEFTPGRVVIDPPPGLLDPELLAGNRPGVERRPARRKS